MSVTELTQALTLHATQRLPAYMVPSAIVVLDALPLTPNGKLDIEALQLGPQHPPKLMQEAPLAPTESKMLGVWRGILHNPALGADDDFFAVGGDFAVRIEDDRTCRARTRHQRCSTHPG